MGMKEKEINVRKTDRVYEIIEKCEKFSESYGHYEANHIVMKLPYYEYIDRINDVIFRKNVILDLTKINKECLEYFFNNFSKINNIIGSYYCYNPDCEFRGNHKLLMVYNDDIKSIVYKNSFNVLNDFYYFFKDFIDEEEFKRFGDSHIILNNNKNIVVDDKHINLFGFNLLYGCNGSGKTMLLKNISNNIKSPIFNLDNSIDRLFEIEYSEIFKYYYKLLTGKDIVEIKSYSDRIYYWLSIGLSYGKLENNVVLFDDMCWGGIDARNKINIIDNLNNYSYSNGVITTACQKEVKGLVKNRVYNPNIIDL